MNFKILVTNDDGIHSPGIFALANLMKKYGEVVVIAPDSQMSAISSALTLHKPLRVNKHFINNVFFGYSVDGTPADCVKLALTTLLDWKPDIVISGINHGLNTSINVLYSGTVAAAFEGAIFDCNSIAVSIDSHDHDFNLDGTIYFLEKILDKYLDKPFDSKVLLNINVPALDKINLKGIKITELSDAIWHDFYDKRIDPFGRIYYWFAGEHKVNQNELKYDDVAVRNGFVSVSPIKIDFTDREKIENLKFLEE